MSKVSGLNEPRVGIGPSPKVMAFAYGGATWIWYCCKNNKHLTTESTTKIVTDLATRLAT